MTRRPSPLPRRNDPNCYIRQSITLGLTSHAAALNHLELLSIPPILGVSHLTIIMLCCMPSPPTNLFLSILYLVAATPLLLTLAVPLPIQATSPATQTPSQPSQQLIRTPATRPLPKGTFDNNGILFCNRDPSAASPCTAADLGGSSFQQNLEAAHHAHEAREIWEQMKASQEALLKSELQKVEKEVGGKLEGGFKGGMPGGDRGGVEEPRTRPLKVSN